MFERFTDRARRVVVLAQEEARDLGHNYIGTEHILLGMLRVSDGVAARALELLGISLDAVRREVKEIIGKGEGQAAGHIPFTPRAKKVLELSLREALQLGHNYIGTEHILLGLINESEGVAAQVLVRLGADGNRVRQKVIELLHGYKPEEAGVVEMPGEAPVVPQAGPRGTASRVARPSHLGPPVRVVGSRIELESITARISEMISRLDLIVERLASMEERVASIERHFAQGQPPQGQRPAARAPRKPPAARKPKPPPAEPRQGSASGETKPALSGV